VTIDSSAMAHSVLSAKARPTLNQASAMKGTLMAKNSLPRLTPLA
jgi:hypothetical protein